MVAQCYVFNSATWPSRQTNADDVIETKMPSLGSLARPCIIELCRVMHCTRTLQLAAVHVLRCACVEHMRGLHACVEQVGAARQ
jgi:hypothetical protein